MDQAPTRPGLLRRLAAIVYDSLLVFSLFFAATGLYQLIGHSFDPAASGSAVSTGEVVTRLEPVASGIGFKLYLLLVMFAFFAWFWHRNGQTLGMQAWRLRVDNLQGERISYAQALVRFAGAWISLLCFGLGYLWVVIDRDKCSWHDRLSRSRLVLLPGKKQK
jgi:uncharacterized RDD family membrane protein YckC